MENLRASDGDAVERFLDSRLSASTAPELRQSILHQTTRVVRQRRRIRRIAYMTGLAACYAAGLATMWFATPVPTTGQIVAIANREPEHENERATVSAPAVDEDPNVPAVVLEKVADGVSETQQARFYIRAGDRYLREDGDFEAALRCYRQALNRLSRTELAISPDDSWIFMALKQAQLEAQQHASTKG